MSETSGSKDNLDEARPAPVRTEAVGLLAAGLAHDLNNILGGIVTTAELLALRRARDAEDQTDLSTIIGLSQRASTMVRQILAFSRQEMLSPATLDLEETFTRLRPLLSSFVGPKVRINLRINPVSVRVDPTAFERMVVNLVVNAGQAIGQREGSITIRVGHVGPDSLPDSGREFMEPARYGVIEVEDDGPGVPPEIANRIFEPFFTTSPQGQGLGLASIFGLVKQSGGYLLHERSDAGGAQFGIYLPLVEVYSEEHVPAATLTGQMVLVVDDEALLRRAMRRGLEQRGFHVEEAEDAEQALALMKQQAPALLLSDIRMPGMDGVELARLARQSYPKLPILLISGYADGAAREVVPGMEVGFLSKPFSLARLGEAVDELI